MRGQIVSASIIQAVAERFDQAPRTNVSAKQIRVEQCNALAAQRILHGQHCGIKNQSALHIEAGQIGSSRELLPEMLPRHFGDPYVHQLIGLHELRHGLVGVPGSDIGWRSKLKYTGHKRSVTKSVTVALNRPPQHRRLRGPAYSVRADEIDFPRPPRGENRAESAPQGMRQNLAAYASAACACRSHRKVPSLSHSR